MKIIKIALLTIAALVLLAVLALAGFVYKVKYGFPVTYETTPPRLEFPSGKQAVLLFSKTTGFRHTESIEASKAVFQELAERNDWFLYSTEDGGVFNVEQLAKFHAVIFNNSTGRVLKDEQQRALEEYVEQGGSLVGIHGAGDDSHHWPWYEAHLTGVKFSHHPIKNQLQEAEVVMDPEADSVLTAGLPNQWTHTDEWYVFYDNPRQRGFKIVYHIDGDKIDPNGNLLLITGKDFGMGKDHPVAWYRSVGKGQTFYTSIGHHALAWKQEAFIRLLENVIQADSNKGNE